MEKMDGKTMDIVAENVGKLKELFPEAFTEGKVDFEVLKEVLGTFVDDRDERYSFTWNGKSKARMIAQTPSTGTLRPCKEESVDWDTTQNIFIEGDNLEVLKLLQKSYHKKVKMIYIDPPYNTGGDFIYKDNFRDNIKNYMTITGQIDSDGRTISTNPETSGRYHTDWLNMIFPRLKLARNILTDDGVIFISIDENECGNLEQVANEIFGPENFVARIVWEKVYTPKSNGRVISTDHDYILMYCKGPLFYETGWNFLPRSEEQSSRFSNSDNDPNGPWRTYPLDVRTENSEKREKYRYEVTTPSGRKVKPSAGRHWSLPYEKFLEEDEAGRIYYGKDGNAMPTKKVYLSEARSGVIARTWWPYKEVGGNQTAKQELINLFKGDPGFLTPKPVSMIQRLIQLSTQKNSIIWDFFAGSCSTMEAVLKENMSDKGDRRFLAVQFPEPCGKGTAALNAGYSTIADIGKERIRLAAAKIKEENPKYEGDLGFKVFKLDSTNIKPWEVDFDMTERTLEDFISNIKTDRREEDVLYEVLLKYGLDLTLPITEHAIAGQKVFDIGMGALIICLSDAISLEVVEDIAKLKDELDPEIMRVVFKDSGFKDDVVKTNAVQILKQAGIVDVRSL